MQFTDLITVLDVPEATNILLVINGCRPATYFVVKSDVCQHLECLLDRDSRIGFLIRKHSEKKGRTNVIVYNKRCFNHDQVVQLTCDASGMGRLLGYIASSDEMGIQSKYKIEYRVNDVQLYAQVCRYLDEERREKAEEQLVCYQQIGEKLGLKISLYCGERNTPEGRPQQRHLLHKDMWKQREEIALRLEKNFPCTAKYFHLDDLSKWMNNYRCYHRLWRLVLQFNPEVEIPGLEMSLYQRWKSISKTKRVLHKDNIDEQSKAEEFYS